MSLITNEELIQEKVNQRKQELITLLKKCYDSETNKLFVINSNKTYKLTELCEKATRIQTTRNNEAIYPSKPKKYNSTTLYGNEINIHNTIQYCNNLLRYMLRKNGIEFNNSNIMEELIRYISESCSFQKLDRYITNIENGDDLTVTYANYTDTETDMVTEISDIENNNFSIKREPFSKNKMAYYYFTINEEHNLVKEKYYLHKNAFISNSEQELLCLFQNIQEGQTIYIPNGTYTIPKNYSLPNCNIVGESKGGVILKNYGITFSSSQNSDIEISNIIFDGNGIDRGDSGFLQFNVEANVQVHDCIFTNMKGKYNCHGIRINNTFPDYSIEIYNCVFEGENKVTNANAKTCSSIAAYNQPTFYNLSIHDNVFNHSISESSIVPVHGIAKAINLFNNNSIATIENCIAYRNKYLGEQDLNVGIEEEEGFVINIKEGEDLVIISDFVDIGKDIVTNISDIGEDGNFIIETNPLSKNGIVYYYLGIDNDGNLIFMENLMNL